MTASGVLEEVEQIISRGGDPEDVLQSVVVRPRPRQLSASDKPGRGKSCGQTTSERLRQMIHRSGAGAGCVDDLVRPRQGWSRQVLWSDHVRQTTSEQLRQMIRRAGRLWR
jgi:hypothetical protein